MHINLLQLRDEIRAYLAKHKRPQTELAKETGVPHSWLNKFCNGAFPNIRLERLQSLNDWVDADRQSTGAAASVADRHAVSSCSER
jgi:DNA-binding Xre family transcriptional regulator